MSSHRPRRLTKLPHAADCAPAADWGQSAPPVRTRLKTRQFLAFPSGLPSLPSPAIGQEPEVSVIATGNRSVLI